MMEKVEIDLKNITINIVEREELPVLKQIIEALARPGPKPIGV